jgi:uncharacterized protein YndB with AHSA1/START domain
MSSSSTDRIEKRILLKAPRSRVWRAITDSKQFGEWFLVAMDGPFVAGQKVQGRITHKDYENLRFEVEVGSIEPETLFSMRWHPYALDPKVDYSGEATTLVEFRLNESPEGTELTVVESGFDRIPLSRRAEAFRMNEDGWSQQMRNIERYVTHPR